MANEDIEQMSDEQLMEEWTVLGSKVQDAQARLRAFSHEHQRRTRKQELVRAMQRAGATEDEAQAIVAAGLESEEAAGEVGGTDG